MSETAPIVDAVSLAVTSGNDVFLVGHGSAGAYLVKLNTAGELKWTKVIGAGLVSPTDIALGLDGSIHTVGMFVETANFDPDNNNHVFTAPPMTQGVFLSKLTMDGDLVWAEALLATATAGPGNSDVSSWGLVVDAEGNVLAAGQYSSTVDFDPSPQAVELNAGEDSNNAFVLRLNADGKFDWVKQFVWLEDVTTIWWGKQGSGADDIALAPDGGILVTGSFIGSLDFDPGDQVFRMTSNATPDMFVAKLAGARTWTSWTHPCDANADGWIVPVDALMLINELNHPKYHDTLGRLLNPPPADMPAFFDPTGDGYIFPLDVLTIINYINRNGSGPVPNGEGEPQAEGELSALDLPGPSSCGFVVTTRAGSGWLASSLATDSRAAASREDTALVGRQVAVADEFSRNQLREPRSCLSSPSEDHALLAVGLFRELEDILIQIADDVAAAECS